MVMRLALFPSELRVYSCALEPRARVLRLQVADVAAGAVALAQRSRLAWLREGSQVVAELAEPVQQLRLAPGQRLKALAQVNGRLEGARKEAFHCFSSSFSRGFKTFKRIFERKSWFSCKKLGGVCFPCSRCSLGAWRCACGRAA